MPDRALTTAEMEGTVVRWRSLLPNPQYPNLLVPDPGKPDRALTTAEMEGFEPSRGLKTSTRLAGGRHKPD